MNKPKTVYAVVCESGDIAVDGGGLKVFDCAVDAHEDVGIPRAACRSSRAFIT